MKLYCITSGSEVFEVWCNAPVMCTFRDSKTADTLARHPEVLKRLPKEMSKGESAQFNDGLFLSKDAAWDAFLNSEYVDRKKYEEETGKKLTRENYAKDVYGRKCLCVDVPEIRSVKLEHVDNESCANCAFDFYTEDDGYEWHKCPFNKDACGRSDQKCPIWRKLSNRR